MTGSKEKYSNREKRYKISDSVCNKGQHTPKQRHSQQMCKKYMGLLLQTITKAKKAVNLSTNTNMPDGFNYTLFSRNLCNCMC